MRCAVIQVVPQCQYPDTNHREQDFSTAMVALVPDCNRARHNTKA